MQKLTDTKIRNAKPGVTLKKLSDGHGLFLAVTPADSKLWRIAYRYAGGGKTLKVGPYPALTLAAARARLLEVQRLLAEGVDPAEARRAQDRTEVERVQNTFEAISREWLEKHAPGWVANHTSRYERYLFKG